MTARALDVEVWFDLVCPWCLIGKRQLEEALAQFHALQPGRRVRVAWRSQALLPDLPPQGVPFRSFYLRRLGSAEAVAARQAQVQEAGLRAGLAFDFERMPVMPNSLAAHAFVADAAAQGGEAVVDAVIDSLFDAHFMRGENLGDPAVLEALAARFGIERTRTAPPPTPTVSVVPLFRVNGAVALGSAQSPGHVVDLLLQAA